MRVRFGELSVAERRARDGVCSRARDAWRQLRAGQEHRACELMNAIDPRIELRLRPSVAGHAPCAELAALEASAWPLSELLLAQAPADVGCALSLGRSAVPLSQALTEVRLSHGLDLGRASLRAGFGRAHLLELTLAVPGGTAAEHQQIAAEDLVRAVLGDRVFETWVGAVHVTPAPRGGPLRVLDARAPRSTLELGELFETVSAAACGVLRGLPAERFADTAPAHPVAGNPLASGGADGSSVSVGVDGGRADWTLLEVEPLARERHRRKDDLLLASTCTPELLRCYLDESPCASRRFSRHGEQFVFVSYPDDMRSMNERVLRRTVIETALSECLPGVGAVTGVGLGVVTSYIDVALCDLETGLSRLVSRLREVGVPEHSFIQFFDSEFSEEWLSIWPGSELADS